MFGSLFFVRFSYLFTLHLNLSLSACVRYDEIRGCSMLRCSVISRGSLSAFSTIQSVYAGLGITRIVSLFVNSLLLYVFFFTTITFPLLPLSLSRRRCSSPFFFFSLGPKDMCDTETRRHGDKATTCMTRRVVTRRRCSKATHCMTSKLPPPIPQPPLIKGTAPVAAFSIPYPHPAPQRLV